MSCQCQQTTKPPGATASSEDATKAGNTSAPTRTTVGAGPDTFVDVREDSPPPQQPPPQQPPYYYPGWLTMASEHNFT
ncbi:hypothetical protein PpBr36_00326 [Pyricularia pennisetigena]|uniref:hypothetical protein n=1 Tax=Pyricularia pennisetigena TaxID=1578925 RepID=UPI001154446F|nr:hypothetical protein PpBr36_00326 [Pyricularia pennisetigena]TLS28774.1 hypothetical protein PpBr36_00326 [Pyricularia pennisetigena]